MSFERTLEGTITFLDRSAKTLRVTQEVQQQGRFEYVSIGFALSPHVSVTSSSRGVLKLAALKIGQKVAVHYVTEPGDRRIANTIAVMEPAAKPRAGFPGVQVAR